MASECCVTTAISPSIFTRLALIARSNPVQGIGRLVRTRTDRGRVVILDSRAKRQRWGASRLTSHIAEFQRAR